jgi:hypothetical protein
MVMSKQQDPGFASARMAILYGGDSCTLSKVFQGSFCGVQVIKTAGLSAGTSEGVIREELAKQPVQPI